ncbi:uncharacterized protein LOC131949277 [Physella acuta]|uniref:uncharacterized protein LOC131949277 n=1 Tax=Physella acuta TaxID=109671 RepID=UPI0027DACDAB|nr:uncharacterized protein LOC131949277 [Physella acuta]
MPAEKGGGIFVWKRELYVKKCYRHLADPAIYSLKKTDHTLTTNSKVFKGIKELIQLNLLPESARNLHLFDSDLGESVFYLLTKNPDAPGRPLVSSNSCPTEHIASVLDGIFKTVVASLPSFIKDTDHAIEKLNLISFRPTKPMRIFRLDACSLYTSIPHKDGLEAVKHYFTKTPHHKLSTDTIVRLTELVLTCNSLEFDGNFYEQIKGVPLGSKMSDSYVSIFMGYLEERINKNYKGNLPKFYFRCNADGIGYMEKTDLEKYITFCKSFYADIKLEYKISNSRVNFLDLRVSVHNDAPFIRTEIVFDPNSFDYLLYTSSHPKAYKEEILQSQLSQLRRACTNDNDFSMKAQEMFGFFRQCLYPELQFKKALKHVSRFSRDSYFLRGSKTTTERLKLFLPYHPHSKSVKDILLRNFNILSSDPDFGSLFKNLPEVIYKPNPSLWDILVHKRLPSLSPPGTSPCKIKNCKLCQYTFETNSIRFPGGAMRVREHFTCLSRGVVYVIKCKLCHECYIGQTGVKLSQRAGQHITSIRKKTKCPVAVHFNAPDHRRLEDFSITAVRSCRNTEERKKLENRLIYKYDPLGPKGMNKIFSLL